MDQHRASIEHLEHRIATLRRAYGRGLGRRPTVVEEHAMQRAARLTARAEQAARDPAVAVNDLVRIDHLAARARASMTDLLRDTKPERSAMPSLKELMERA